MLAVGAGTGAGRSSSEYDVPDIDLETVQKNLTVELGEEQAKAVLDSLGKPLKWLLDKHRGDAAQTRINDLASKAETAEQFFNSADSSGIYGKSYDAATPEEKALRISVARAAHRMLNAGLASDWPTAMRKAHHAENAEKLVNRAKGDAKGELVNRSRITTPRPSAGKSGAPPTPKRSGIDAIADAIGPILDGGGRGSSAW